MTERDRVTERQRDKDTEIHIVRDTYSQRYIESERQSETE